jgi:hypothetical protein
MSEAPEVNGADPGDVVGPDHFPPVQLPDDDQAAALPVPVIAGTFAIYEDGRGGFVLVTDTEQHGQRRDHIPSAVVRLASGGGLIGRKFKGLFA